MKILITGSTGFIGMHVSQKFLENEEEVVGIDNINDYYSVKLKNDRNNILLRYGNYKFYNIDIKDEEALDKIVKEENIKVIIHLAAQANVKYSLVNPRVYMENNIIGFFNILETCRKNKIDHLYFASSSSVYGKNLDVPYKETDNTDFPISFYGATKKSNEIMAYPYSHLYNIPMTGMRFFTVFGEWGRPDMVPILFTRAIIEGNEITLRNNGKLVRDFTYVGKIREMIYLLYKINIKNNYKKYTYSLFNMGNSHPISMHDFIKIIEKKLGLEAKIKFSDELTGELVSTYSDSRNLSEYIKIADNVNFEEKMSITIDWIKNYYY